MKSSVLFILILTLSYGYGFGQWGTNGSNSLSTGKDAEIKWEMTTIDIGDIKQYNPQDVTYKFTNMGGKPIIITGFNASCGCTDVEYPRKPILPGQTATVVVTFDAETPGVFNKSVTLTMNIEKSSQVLHLKGTVIN
jgi:hypothetical protein